MRKGNRFHRGARCHRLTYQRMIPPLMEIRRRSGTRLSGRSGQALFAGFAAAGAPTLGAGGWSTRGAALVSASGFFLAGGLCVVEKSLKDI